MAASIIERVHASGKPHMAPFQGARHSSADESSRRAISSCRRGFKHPERRDPQGPAQRQAVGHPTDRQASRGLVHDDGGGVGRHLSRRGHFRSHPAPCCVDTRPIERPSQDDDPSCAGSAGEGRGGHGPAIAACGHRLRSFCDDESIVRAGGGRRAHTRHAATPAQGSGTSPSAIARCRASRSLGTERSIRSRRGTDVDLD